TCPGNNAPFSGSTFTIPVVGGTQYLIQVGSFTAGNTGTTILHITLAGGGGCTLPPAPGNQFNENEPCGTDTNGGCNATPNIFTPISIGQTALGNMWADTIG